MIHKVQWEGSKVCKVCKEDKPLTEYWPNKTCRQGRVGTCRECSKTYTRKWYKKHSKRLQDLYNKRNRKYKDEVIEHFGDKCHDCGQSYPPCVYDFHHLDSANKDMNPSRAIQLGSEKRWEELNKCIMLCANCHRIRHFHKRDD